jgi:WhiB family redox-sensing transcriptional regulator
VALVSNHLEVGLPDFAEFERIAQRLVANPPDPEPDLSWRKTAACRDTSPELFFPIGTTGPAIDQIAAARAVCMACPSRVPCLEFALWTNQDSGVWGATSEEDRRHLRRTYLARRR